MFHLTFVSKIRIDSHFYLFLRRWRKLLKCELVFTLSAHSPTLLSRRSHGINYKRMPLFQSPLASLKLNSTSAIDARLCIKKMFCNLFCDLFCNLKRLSPLPPLSQPLLSILLVCMGYQEWNMLLEHKNCNVIHNGRYVVSVFGLFCQGWI